jgi:hypothetical protein
MGQFRSRVVQQVGEGLASRVFRRTEQDRTRTECGQRQRWNCLPRHARLNCSDNGSRIVTPASTLNSGSIVWTISANAAARSRRAPCAKLSGVPVCAFPLLRRPTVPADLAELIVHVDVGMDSHRVALRAVPGECDVRGQMSEGGAQEGVVSDNVIRRSRRAAGRDHPSHQCGERRERAARSLINPDMYVPACPYGFIRAKHDLTLLCHTARFATARSPSTMTAPVASRSSCSHHDHREAAPA